MTTTLRRPTELETPSRPSSPGWFLPLANLVAWVTFVGIALAVQPAIDPEAPVDPTGLVISLVLWSAMFAAVFGLFARASWGYAATAVGGVALVAAAVSCFAGGHTGAWVVSQGLAGAGLATTGTVSWMVSR